MFTKCGNGYVFLYLALITFFLLVNPRLLSVVITDGAGYLLLASLLFLLVISKCLYSDLWRTHGIITFFAGLCLTYAVFIASIGLVYAMGWLSVDAGAVANAEGWPASKAFRQTMLFEFIYLFFPFMLLGQYVLLCKVDLLVVIRWIVGVWLLVAGVLFYQMLVDQQFLRVTPWVWYERYGGLASDPNAYALLAFLMCAFLTMGWKLEESRLMKSLYILLLLILVLSAWFTGTRTAAAGLFVFMMLIPFILAVSYVHWSVKIRIVVVLLPFVILLLGLLSFSMLGVDLHDIGGAGSRLVGTWNKFEVHGLIGLFNQDEARGGLYHIAWLLIMGAAWSGWGPGGFYREYSNIMYDQTGQIHKAFDSPLNHYLMIGCDFGIPVLILNLAMLLFPLFIGVQFLRKVKSVNERFVVATLLVSNVIFLMMINTMPPSYFLEVMWVWTAQLAILLVMGVRHQVFKLHLSARVVKGLLIVFSVLLFVVLFHAGDIAMHFGDRAYP